MVQNTEQSVQEVQSAAQPAAPDRAPAVRALVLTGFGINCEEEVAAAYRLAGAEATIVHLNQVLHGQVSIHDFDVLTFPGGFSFGDDLGSGVVLANKLRYRQTGVPHGQRRTLLDDLKEFVAAGKFVLGICNGFQVLVKLGLLPNLGGGFRPEVTLTHNASGRYENRWVRLQVNPNTKSPFLAGLTSLEVPVRHGEGRLVLPDAATAAALEAAGLNCLSYVDAAGDGTSQYPLNPNGAALNCAGLTDTTGQVLGLMPHPEAFLMAENHPDWARRRRLGAAGGVGEGLALFENIVRHVQSRAGGAASVASPPGPLSGGEGEPDGAASSSTSSVVAEPAGKYGAAGAGVDARLTTDKSKWHQTLKGFGQQMRRHPTPAEDALWQALRNRQVGSVKFRRQHSIGRFIVDFFSSDHKLIIEVDGGVHQEAEQAEYDAGRTHELQALGYKVVRFSNEQVLEQLSQTITQIEAAATT